MADATISSNVTSGSAISSDLTQGAVVSSSVVASSSNTSTVTTGGTGPTGATGAAGADGQGVPTGGTDGQVLTKLSSTNYDTAWETPSGGSGAVDSVNGATGVVTLDQDDIGDGTTYKQYSATEKTKLAGIATAATANSADATLLARTNHTGTQAASTISDFSTAADARISAAVGVSVQAYDADLTTWGGKTAPSGTVVGTSDAQTLTNKTTTGLKMDGALDTGGVKIIEYTPNASAVNYLVQRAGSTGQAVLMSAESVTDTNVYLNLQSQGIGTVRANGVDVVTTTGTQTLTNKTLTSPAVTTPTGIVKGDVGLGNVDNTSNATERAATATLTNKRITKRSLSVSNDTTLDIDTDAYDYAEDTGLTGAVTVTWSGTPTAGQTLWVSLTGTAARGITWDTDFEASTVALPTTTVTTARLDVAFIWNAATSKFRCIAAV